LLIESKSYHSKLHYIAYQKDNQQTYDNSEIHQKEVEHEGAT